MITEQSIHTGSPFGRKSVFEYPLSKYMAGVCAPLPQGMAGQVIHLLGTHQGKNPTANLTFTIFLLHHVSCRGCRLPLESVAHFCQREENSNKVRFGLNSWEKMDIKKMLRKQSWRKMFFKKVKGYQGKIQEFMYIEKKVEIRLLPPEWNWWFPIFLLIRFLVSWLSSAREA